MHAKPAFPYTTLMTLLFGIAAVGLLWSETKLAGPIVSILILTATFISVLHHGRLDRARRALTESEAHARQKSRELELTLEHMGQGILVIDGEGEVVIANDKAVTLLALPVPAKGQRLQFDNVVEELLQRGEFGTMEQSSDQVSMQQVRWLRPGLERDYYERKRHDGTVLAVDSQRMPDGGFVRTITDITERHRSAENIARLARYDALTNVANRSSFRERLDDALARLCDGEGFALMIVGLDSFKNINDAHGHSVGDKLLRLAALRLRGAVRTEDMVARLGGDEFAIILDDMADPKLGRARAQHLVDLLREPYVVDDLLLNSSASVGCTIAPKDGTNAGELLRNADVALQGAKAGGRNTCRMFSQEVSPLSIERRGKEGGHTNASPSGKLDLHDQPHSGVRNGRSIETVGGQITSPPLQPERAARNDANLPRVRASLGR